MHISAPVDPVLSASGIAAGYGKIAVLEDVALDIGTGEAVGLVGPNGAGKTTLLNVLSGLLPRSAGEVRFEGAGLPSGAPRATGRAGIVQVVEGHRVFSKLSVRDNIELGGYEMQAAARRARLDDVLQTFPELRDRLAEKAGALSGGQRQMLCIAQGLMRAPKLIMLDEPSAGLAPILVDRVVKLVDDLSTRGVSVLFVDQLVDRVAATCDRVYLMRQGRIIGQTSAADPGFKSRLEDVFF